MYNNGAECTGRCFKITQHHCCPYCTFPLNRYNIHKDRGPSLLNSCNVWSMCVCLPWVIKSGYLSYFSFLSLRSSLTFFSNPFPPATYWTFFFSQFIQFKLQRLTCVKISEITFSPFWFSRTSAESTDMIVHALYVHAFMHYTTAMWLSAWIFAWISQCGY